MTLERQRRKDQIQDLGRLFYRERRHLHRGEPGTGKTPTICVLQRARWTVKIDTSADSIDQHIVRLTKRKSVEAAQVERGRVPVPWSFGPNRTGPQTAAGGWTGPRAAAIPFLNVRNVH